MQAAHEARRNKYYIGFPLFITILQLFNLIVLAPAGIKYEEQTDQLVVVLNYLGSYIGVFMLCVFTLFVSVINTWADVNRENGHFFYACYSMLFIGVNIYNGLFFCLLDYAPRGILPIFSAVLILSLFFYLFVTKDAPSPALPGIEASIRGNP